MTQPKEEVDENTDSERSDDEGELPEVCIGYKPKPSDKGKAYRPVKICSLHP